MRRAEKGMSALFCEPGWDGIGLYADAFRVATVSMGEEEVAHAISAHYTGWGVAYETVLDKALLACDELTGFIGACCLLRPNGIADLTAKSVKKRLKDKRFAAKVERPEVRAGAELLGVELDEHITFVIEALRPHAAELGLEGTGA